MHKPFLYKHIHKLHHKYTQAVGICATFAHPIEYAFGNMIPVGIPCLLLGSRMHFYTYLVWVVYRIVATTSGHSGYDLPGLPWDIMILRGSSTYHDFHHSNGDFCGNYSGQTTIYDTLWGTNNKYYKHLEKLIESKRKSD